MLYIEYTGNGQRLIFHRQFLEPLWKKRPLHEIFKKSVCTNWHFLDYTKKNFQRIKFTTKISIKVNSLENKFRQFFSGLSFSGKCFSSLWSISKIFQANGGNLFSPSAPTTVNCQSASQQNHWTVTNTLIHRTCLVYIWKLLPLLRKPL